MLSVSFGKSSKSCLREAVIWTTLLPDSKTATTGACNMPSSSSRTVDTFAGERHYPAGCSPQFTHLHTLTSESYTHTGLTCQPQQNQAPVMPHLLQDQDRHMEELRDSHQHLGLDRTLF